MRCYFCPEAKLSFLLPHKWNNWNLVIQKLHPLPKESISSRHSQSDPNSLRRMFLKIWHPELIIYSGNSSCWIAVTVQSLHFRFLNRKWDLKNQSLILGSGLFWKPALYSLFNYSLCAILSHLPEYSIIFHLEILEDRNVFCSSAVFCPQISLKTWNTEPV